jgi:O-antigen ligase/polysaccharide polymerase Wzy-like membrane protein
MKTDARTQLTTLCSLVIALTLILLPFHALLTVWAGSNWGHYEAVRLWKEWVLVALLVPAGYLWWTNKQLRRSWWHSPLVMCTVAYIFWQLLLGLYAWHAGWVNRTALIDGWATDLRFVLFFLLCWITAANNGWLAARWRWLLLGPAAAVVVFGFLQLTALPADVLRHAGYGSNTIVPFETVDQKAAYVRVQSTLRGPNALGAYLVLIVATLWALALQTFARRRWRPWVLLSLAATLVVLWFTYSRSAYLGAALATAVVCWLLVRSGRVRQRLVAALGVILVVAAAMFIVLRHNNGFQNTFFHTDSRSTSLHSSNQNRADALRQGVRDVIHQPLGRGAGSAGPASAHNNHPVRIAENYYLQIGQESGWIGLALFIIMNALVALTLWRRRSHPLAIVLLASFAGISLVNLLSHAWADDTLGMVWWGLAGVAMALPQVTSKEERA